MGLIDTIASRFRSRSRTDLELDYLNEATSVIDLELRQREIDRGRFRQGQIRR